MRSSRGCSPPISTKGATLAIPPSWPTSAHRPGWIAPRFLVMLASDEGQADVRSELRRAKTLRVSGVPTVLVDGVPLFSGAIRADLMETELRKAAGHVGS